MYLGSDLQGPWTGKSNEEDCAACVKALQKKDKKKIKEVDS